ncbi:MAG: prepilin peptidase [Coriobacteriales bacterium]
MELAFIITALAFAAGFFIVPYASRELLIYKYQEINRSWNSSLEDYRHHLLFTRRKPSTDGERVEREMALWGKRQITLVTAGKLSYEKVCALREAGVLPTRPRARDPSLALPREREVEESYRLNLTLPLRLGCGALLAAAALALGLSDAPPLAVASGIAAGALMESIFLCDMRARIIPWQLCLLFGVAGVVFSLSVSGLEGLGISLFTALGMSILLQVTNRFMGYLSGRPAIGDGDLRLIPMICIFSGLAGTLYGFVGASLVMGLVAAATVLFKGGNRKTYVPYAPGLSCWYAIGLVTQLACI